jgi:hypothetical protein
MLDYETHCKIRDCHERGHLTIAQTARALGLHPQAVSKWLKADQYRRRQSPPRASRLDPFKAQVVRWLDGHPYSVQQTFQRLREVGFDGHRCALGGRAGPSATIALVSYFFAMESAARGAHRRSSNLSVYYKDCKIGDSYAYLLQPERSRSNMRRTSVGISRHQFCFASVILEYRVTLPVVTTK